MIAMKKTIAAIVSVTFFLFGCATYLDDPFPAPQNDDNELVFGLNTFGFNVYKQLKDSALKDKNFVISPYSISNCLAMVYAGARNATAQQMATVLHYTLPQSEMPAAFGDLTTGLVSKNNFVSTPDDILTLKIANSGWFQENDPFPSAYIDALTTGYGAEVSTVDFKNQTEEIRALINQWADNATGGKIPELIPEGFIDSLTRFVVVNTIYLKAAWQYPFKKEFTRESPFYLLDGSTKSVPMMNGGELGLQYLEEKDYQAVVLPFNDNGTLAMAIILPRKGLYEKVEQKITGGGLYSLVHRMKEGLVWLRLPKFYTRNSLNLADTCKAMGMTDVFSSDTADLTGMSDQPPLYLSFIIHEVVIAVDENGTEAAAATATGGSTASPEPVEFLADHPFLYAIFDRETDAVLFLGRVLSPEQKQ
jgi:serpin B